MRDDSGSARRKLSRRAFLSSAGSSAAAVAIAGRVAVPATIVEPDAPEGATDAPSTAGTVPVTLRINGKEHRLEVDPRTTLLDCVRETVASPARRRDATTGSAARAPSTSTAAA